MGLDIRLPIGGFFAIIGIVLAAYGLFGDPSIYQRSLGIDVNTIWGLVLVVFGAAMLFFGRRAAARKGPHE
jgi:multisubunit Na+/H+ antiporter MnhG subunit